MSQLVTLKTWAIKSVGDEVSPSIRSLRNLAITKRFSPPAVKAFGRWMVQEDAILIPLVQTPHIPAELIVSDRVKEALSLVPQAS